MIQVFLQLTCFERLCSQYFQTDNTPWFHLTFVFYFCKAIVEELFLVCPFPFRCHQQGKSENDYSYVYDFSIVYNFNIVTHNSPGYKKEITKNSENRAKPAQIQPPHTTSAVSCQMYNTLQLLRSHPYRENIYAII
jgi:hypothetical protein